jgi:curved DNA-binding protein CbpA
MRVLLRLLLLVSVMCCVSTWVQRVQAAGANDDGDPDLDASAMTYYELLELDPNEPVDFDLKVIKKAYRKAALKYHPDRVPPGSSEEKSQYFNDMFVRMSNAFDVLSVPLTRKRYDTLLKKGIKDYDDNYRQWEDGQSYERTYYSARDQYERAMQQERNMTSALLLSFVGAGTVALLPFSGAVKKWFAKRAALKNSKRDMRQAVVDAELETTRMAEQEKMRREANAEHRRVIEEERQQRLLEEDQVQEYEEDGGGETNKEEEGEEKSNGGDAELTVENAPKEVDESRVEPDKEKRQKQAQSQVLKCQVCTKNNKFKSLGQLENHYESSRHKKEVKKAAKGGGKRKPK